MKIAVIGGGSTYTPELVDGFARLRDAAGLHVDELVLVDPAEDRLGVVGPFSARIFAHYGHPGRVTWTSDVDSALNQVARDWADRVTVRLTGPMAPYDFVVATSGGTESGPIGGEE